MRTAFLRQATSCSANVPLEVSFDGSIGMKIINIFKPIISAVIEKQALAMAGHGQAVQQACAQLQAQAAGQLLSLKRHWDTTFVHPSIAWELRLSQKLAAFNRVMLPPGASDLLMAPQQEAGHRGGKGTTDGLGFDAEGATDAAAWVQTTMETFEDLIPATHAAAATMLPPTNLRLAERRLEAAW
eukprot:Skav228454  [mRNA]  locus=scaffold1058:189286:192977:- [translate_table: standard]